MSDTPERTLCPRSLYLFGFGALSVVCLLSAGMVLIAAWNGELGRGAADTMMILGGVLGLGVMAFVSLHLATARLYLGRGWIEAPGSLVSLGYERIHGRDVKFVSDVLQPDMPSVMLHFHDGSRRLIRLDPYGRPEDLRRAVLQALGLEAPAQV